MENVYFYKYNIGKNVENTLKQNKKVLEGGKIEVSTDDIVSHIDYIIRDCKLLGSDRKGYLLYVKGDQEQIDYVEKKLKGLEIEKIEGEEKENIVKTIVTEEDSAASGMGMIFG